MVTDTRFQCSYAAAETWRHLRKNGIMSVRRRWHELFTFVLLKRLNAIGELLSHFGNVQIIENAFGLLSANRSPLSRPRSESASMHSTAPLKRLSVLRMLTVGEFIAPQLAPKCPKRDAELGPIQRLGNGGLKAVSGYGSAILTSSRY